MRISDWSSDVCSSDLEAMGRILAGGVRDMADWVNKLYGQAFAAVYVQPGARVAVHLEQPLDIDYDAKGRGVHHRTGATHASDLDCRGRRAAGGHPARRLSHQQGEAAAARRSEEHTSELKHQLRNPDAAL